MKNLMKAAVAHDYDQALKIEDIFIPLITEDEILVKIQACGVCHTDLHAVSGDWVEKAPLPFIPGHEGAGIVKKVGKKVKNLQIGDRVGVSWLYSACGQCEYCYSGWETLCEFQKNTGYSVNGCYAQYVVANPNYVVILPSNLSFEQAASLLCAGLTVYKGIKETNTKPGDWLIIYGIGGLGHLAIQYAKAMGLKVIAIDIHAAQLALAKELGSDSVIDALADDPLLLIQASIPRGVHGVLMTNTSADSFNKAIGLVRPGGTVVLMGLPPGNFQLSIFDMVAHRKTVRGSIVGSRLDLIECLQFAADGKVRVHYSLEKLENINTVFEKMKKGEIVGRIVLKIK
jgi:propanol-preferring alcohol dehydrogenase